MPRERSTWNRDDIVKRATVKTADPYLMNQDHVKVQPPADKYVTGDPSDFAEDVHPSNKTWEAEYSGGQVKRNEIGMPEMRADTFNHPEKTASEEVLTKKAALCVAIARAMLPKTASESDVEEQSISFMHLPDAEVMATYSRLAGQEEGKEGEDEGQEAKQAGEMPPQFKENAEKKKEEAEAKKDDDKGEDKKANQDQVAQAVQALQQGDAQAAQAMVQQAMQEQMAQQQQQAQGQQQMQGQQEMQAQQQMMAQLQQQVAQLQQQLAQMQQQACEPMAQQQMPVQANQQQMMAQQQMQAQQMQDAIQAAIQAGQDPVQAAQQIVMQMQQQAQGQQQMPMAQDQMMPSQQQMMGDDALIDQMLASDGGIQAPAPAAMDIELETPSMDVGEVSLGPEDDVLRQLFANDEAQQAQQAQEGGDDQGQQKQAHAVRTASTRTIGTRPTQGVSQIGGGPAAGKGNEIGKLASLWGSAPNVKEAFGLPDR